MHSSIKERSTIITIMIVMLVILAMNQNLVNTVGLYDFRNLNNGASNIAKEESHGNNIILLYDESVWNEHNLRLAGIYPFSESSPCDCTIEPVKPDDFSELNWDNSSAVIVNVISAKKYHKLLDRVPPGVAKILYWREACYPYLTPDTQEKFDILMGTQFTATVLNPCHYPHRFYEDNILPIVDVPFKNRTHFAAYISSRCSENGTSLYDSFRDNFIDKLGELMDVEVYGKCAKQEHSFKVPDSWEREGLKNFYSNFKYYIAVENTGTNNYVSEKVFFGLGSGAIPVYLGATDIDKFPKLDGRSEWFINARDFPSVEALAAFLIDLAGDEERFEKYLEWQNYAKSGGTWMPTATGSLKECFDDRKNLVNKYSLADGSTRIVERKETICKLCNPEYLETLMQRGIQDKMVKTGYPPSWNLKHTCDDNDAGFTLDKGIIL